MAKSNNVTTFKLKSPTNFVTFLERFSAIERGLLLELTKTHMLAKSHTPDRSSIKYSTMPIGDVLEGDVPFDLIKIAIYDIKKVINVFKQFGESDEIFMDLKHEDISNERIGIEIKFRTKDLKIKVDCADVTLYTYIKPEVLKKIIDGVREEMILEFPFPKESFTKVSSLCSMDTTNDLLTINVTDGQINFNGKSFECHIGDAPVGKNAELVIYNKQFAFIDPEISGFVIGTNKMLIRSQESSTIMIIAKVE